MGDFEIGEIPCGDVRDLLGGAVDCVAGERRRLIITRWGIDCMVLVPLEDLRVLLALSDLSPLEIARMPAQSDESEISKAIIIGWLKGLDE